MLLLAFAALVVNRHGEAWFNATLFAVMFAGTVLYRHFNGEMSTRVATATYVAIASIACTTVVFSAEHQSWAITFSAAFMVFGAMYSLRRLRYPRILVFLGTISYSIYLLHPVVYALVPRLQAAPVLGMVLALLITVAVASVTYRWLEVPMIRFARRYPASPRKPQIERGALDARGRA
jgi:peptidoglycan/LPS O-acetylase OafA/YrhL